MAFLPPLLQESLVCLETALPCLLGQYWYLGHEVWGLQLWGRAGFSLAHTDIIFQGHACEWDDSEALMSLPVLAEFPSQGPRTGSSLFAATPMTPHRYFPFEDSRTFRNSVCSLNRVGTVWPMEKLTFARLRTDELLSARWSWWHRWKFTVGTLWTEGSCWKPRPQEIIPLERSPTGNHQWELRPLSQVWDTCRFKPWMTFYPWVFLKVLSNSP